MSYLVVLLSEKGDGEYSKGRSVILPRRFNFPDCCAIGDILLIYSRETDKSLVGYSLDFMGDDKDRLREGWFDNPLSMRKIFRGSSCTTQDS